MNVSTATIQPMQKPQARYAALGKRLGEVFAGAGEDQSDTAARLEKTQSYVSRLVRGIERPSMQLLSKINQEYELGDLDGLMKLARFIEDPDATPAPDPNEAVAEAVVRKLIEQGLIRTGDGTRRNIPAADDQLTATDLSQVRLGETERPQDYFWRRFGELADLAEGFGLAGDMELPRFKGGSNESLATQEQAEMALDTIVQQLVSDHPQHAAAFRGWLEGGG